MERNPFLTSYRRCTPLGASAILRSGPRHKPAGGNWRLLGALDLQSSLEKPEVARYQQNKAQLQDEIENLNRDIDQLQKQQETPPHIPVQDLPESDRFRRLLTERKHFIDTLKLIAYRAETSRASL
jgi:hypothetical protein